MRIKEKAQKHKPTAEWRRQTAAVSFVFGSRLDEAIGLPATDESVCRGFYICCLIFTEFVLNLYVDMTESPIVHLLVLSRARPQTTRVSHHSQHHI